MVGVGEMAVSNNVGVTLSTYALGSCVGVIAYDPTLHAGGILHFMLPESRLAPEKGSSRPSMFGDTGLRAFLKDLKSLRVEPRRMKIVVAGGAAVIGKSDMFKIGERNVEAARQFLRAEGLKVFAHDTGGQNNRTVHLELRTGELCLKLPTGPKKLCLR